MRFSNEPKLKRVPRLSEQVAKFLASEIEKGSLQPGEMLPSEAELSSRFEVSRTVIREALARLKYDGLLESRQGSKCKVIGSSTKRAFRFDQLKHTDSTEIGHLYEFRVILESEAAALAAKRRNKEDLARLSRCLEASNQAMRKGLNGTTENVNFHQIIVETSGNPFLNDFMRFLKGKIWDLVQEDRNLSKQEGLSLDRQQEHVTIFEAISTGNSDKARESVQAHLKNAAKRRGITIFNSR